ncbi:IS66 family insertion sequence element accessory protein TnpB [Zunongwangia sp. SCSIO 43204]|uniref:IS66 family insertion sequence element accessory protein TnpB n=1 Tax=Zunongwangia sp. SCSIO 43204 TaxID=2779359 RepID=UPI001CA7C43A|nr:IS66 family insertion sequence element accessory protein TnpB [Zunongwangia sp. SCSIO 43204]UAB85904.1 IS66 family insertion sequence element accessory protein TnpB [Zunongwangia sp. SCSIO 43204]
MFALSSSLNYQLYLPGTDMRKSFDGLCGLVLGELGHSPQDGSVYIFINKARNKVKLLHWQSGGFVLYYKRLERGTFELPDYDASVGGLQLDYIQLVMLIEGVAITNITRRKRYKKAG